MKINLSANVLAQGLHVSLGALGVFVPVAMVAPHGQAVGSVVTLVFAAIKESWFDQHFEDAATAASGWVDFSFYVVGVGAANLLLRFR